MRRAISMIVELFMSPVRVEQNLAHAGFQLDVKDRTELSLTIPQELGRLQLVNT